MLLDDLIRHNARLYPSETAIICGSQRLTFQDVRQKVNRLAAGFFQKGIRKGQRVAILSQNCPEYILLYFSLAKIGAVPVTLNYRLKEKELSYIINNAQSVALIVSEDYLETARALKPMLDTVKIHACTGSRAEGFESIENIMEGASDAKASFETLYEDDVILQMYTSGTTGLPKGAMLTHRNLLSNAYTFTMEQGMRTKDKVLLVVPLYHAAGLLCTLCALVIGATIIIHKSFEPQEVLNAIEKERINHLLLVPAMVVFLLQVPGVEKRDFSSLKNLIYGAAPMPVENLRKAMDVFGCSFIQGYGQTEASAVLTILKPDEHILQGPQEKVRRLASCGRELIGYEVKVVDETGQEILPGTIGEIVARGDSIMKGYFNLPEATAETLKDGWLHTGDLATVDEDGYIFIVDRLKDMIISGAENIYPREIEEVLYAHPAVLEAAVIGVPDEKWGEAVKAIVALKEGARATEQELIEHCAQSLAGFKKPKSVDFISALPRNPSGKVLKTILREPYWRDKTRRVH